MAISVTSIGTGSVHGSSFSVSIPGGGIPAGALIFGGIYDGSTTGIGSISDSVGNTYNNIAAVTANRLFGWYSSNVTSLSSGQSITYNLHSSNNIGVGSFIYATGISISLPVDSNVSVQAHAATNQPSALVSGTPQQGGELFIAVSEISASTSTTYNQDTTNNWVAPPTAISFSFTPNNITLGGGFQVNSGIGTITFQPTFSSNGSWASFIAGFFQASPNNSLVNGAGNLSVDALPPAQIAYASFSGTGSLSAHASIAVAGYSNLNGAGSFSAKSQLALIASATFSGTGSLSPHAIDVSYVTFGGTGSLSSAVTLHEVGFAEFDGAGSLSTLVSLHEAAFAEFDGKGSMLAISVLGGGFFFGSGSLLVNTIQHGLSSTSFNGAGSLSGSITLNIAGFENLSGAGSLLAKNTLAVAGYANFSSTGSLSVKVTLHEAGYAAFNGSGSFASNSSLLGLATFQGSGSLLPIVGLGLIARASFGGTGSLSASQFGGLHETGVLVGLGSLTANTTWNQSARAQLNGTGLICVQGQVFIGSDGAGTNVEVAGRGPTEQAIAGGGSISPPIPPSPPTPPITVKFYVAEDGTEFYVTEDGASNYVTEDS